MLFGSKPIKRERRKETERYKHTVDRLCRTQKEAADNIEGERNNERRA